MVKKNFGWLVVLFFCLLTSWAFLTPGFIPTHDLEYHFIRLWQFDKVIQSGELFPRWAPDLNYGLGAPLFNFFYPLPNYIGEFFHLSGFSLIDSWKLTMAAGLIFSGLFFFLWMADLFGPWPAAVGAVFYILAPYHLLDLYVRGTPGEIWALAFYPAILWAVAKKSLWVGVFLALLILSHNILAVIFLPVMIGYMIYTIYRTNRRIFSLFSFLFSLFSGFSLSAFFWLPAIFESRYVSGLNPVNLTDHFPVLFQLIFPSWGTGFSVAGIMDGLSFQVGIPHLLAVFLSLILLAWSGKKEITLFLFFWDGFWRYFY